MSVTATASPVSKRELELTRIIDAPREAIYRAWTEPELFKQWFAPLPYTTPVAEMDVRGRREPDRDAQSRWRRYFDAGCLS